MLCTRKLLLCLIFLVFDLTNVTCVRRRAKSLKEASSEISEGVEKDVPGSYRRPQPNLILTKRIMSPFIAESMEMVVQYQLFNVGDGAAKNIHVEDFVKFDGESAFEFVYGSESNYKLNFLAPMTNFTFNVTLVPLKEMWFTVSYAKVSYQRYHDATECSEQSLEVCQGEDKFIGWSDLSTDLELGEKKLRILSKTEAEQIYGEKKVDVFLLWTAITLSILIPYLLYKLSEIKYSRIQTSIDKIRKYKKVLKKVTKKKPSNVKLK